MWFVVKKPFMIKRLDVQTRTVLRFYGRIKITLSFALKQFTFLRC